MSTAILPIFQHAYFVNDIEESVHKWHRLYGAGPFVAGVTLDAFNALGLCHIPVGAGNTEKLIAAVQNLRPQAMALTPSYALRLAEWAGERGIDLAASSVRRLLAFQLSCT